MTGTRKILLVPLTIALAIAALACSGAKQDAAVALDGARLAVSDAQKGPAATFAASDLSVSEIKLAAAEMAFRNKDYEKSVAESRSSAAIAKAADASGRKLASAKKPEPAKAKTENSAKAKKKYDKAKLGKKQ